ncbi:MAG: hypothetical protein NUW37_05840, partial [Planctomycetes bacterium]|nr:hypothetical protein [Planctomycetota bacterium]
KTLLMQNIPSVKPGKSRETCVTMLEFILFDPRSNEQNQVQVVDALFKMTDVSEGRNVLERAKAEHPSEVVRGYIGERAR